MIRSKCKKPLLGLVAGLLLYVPAICVQAEPVVPAGDVSQDIDIFLTNDAAIVGKPNVVFLVGNPAVWSNKVGGLVKRDIIHQALYEVLTDKNLMLNDTGDPIYNVGLMAYNSSNQQKGANVIYRTRPIDLTGMKDLASLLYGTDVSSKPIPWDDSTKSFLPYDPTWTPQIDDGNNSPYGHALAEVYRYYSGGLVLGGNLDTDPSTKEPIYDGTAIDGDGDGVAEPTENKTLPTARYISPVTDMCARNIVILLATGAPDNGENTGAEKLLTKEGGILPSDPIALTPNNYEASWGDEWSRLLGERDMSSSMAGHQNLIVYTVDIATQKEFDSTTNPDVGARVYMQSIAYQGGGSYHPATDIDSLKEALRKILAQVQDVDGMFASTTLPVSINVRGTNLNQVYMGVFRPNESGEPTWLGNLKLYKLALQGDNLILADQNSNPATELNSEFIIDTAESFWTTADGTGYWGGVTAYVNTPSDLPDGGLVEKGGAAQVIRNQWTTDNEAYMNAWTGSVNSFQDGYFTRADNIFSCMNYTTLAGCTVTDLYNSVKGLPEFTDQSLFGGAGLAADKMLRYLWVAGYDAQPLNSEHTSHAALPFFTYAADNTKKWSETQFDTTFYTVDTLKDGTYESLIGMRPSHHGDVLHSRPAVINYNTTYDDKDVVVFYGSNDGHLRAIQGGDSQATGLPAPGTELWTFIAEEKLTGGANDFDTLYDNAALPRVESTTNRTLYGKPYFFDGSIGVLQKDDPDPVTGEPDGKPDLVYIYPSMRRGGSALYALDVTNPRVKPSVLWRVDPTMTGFGAMGDTWSDPKVTTLYYDTSPTAAIKPAEVDAVIIGGGYDDLNDTIDQTNSLAPYQTGVQGNAIYVINAKDGSLIKSFTTDKYGNTIKHSIAASVTVVDRNRDGYTDRIYAADTGGNIWKVTIPQDSKTAAWEMVLLASLGTSSSTDYANMRRFLYPPDVVYTKSGYDAILIGSGNREYPFGMGVENYFYMLKDLDQNETNGPVTDQAVIYHNGTQLYDVTYNLIQTGTQTEATGALNILNSAANRGWKMGFLMEDANGNLIPAKGTKVVGSAITLGGVTYFNTNRPTPPDVNSCESNRGEARAYAVSFLDATYDASTTSGRYTVVPGGGYPPSPVPVVVDIGGQVYSAVISGTQVYKPPQVQFGNRKRVFWYTESE